MNDPISVNEAADLLDVKPDRVRKLCQQDKLTCEKLGDRVWMVSRASVEEYRDTAYRKPGPRPNEEDK